ncbi:unnamed protein product [Prorocentrum cordatum]|uniref:Uncharacterized protein n=1 Tax=Prorocentrum cordatum TaxID=2364126 RepID=A0ABN9UA78_9DINO|nr:unnamed protein product [Polarella glacialis]
MGDSRRLNYSRRLQKDTDLKDLSQKDVSACEDLDFSKNRLCGDRLQKVLDVCGKCEKLRVLKLFMNDIDDDGAEALAALVRRTPTIEEMHLSHNRFTSRGVEAIVEAADGARPSKANPLWLRLEQNDVSDPDKVMQKLQSRFSVCARKDRDRCTVRMCVKHCRVHLPHFRFQRGGVQGDSDGVGEPVGRRRKRPRSEAGGWGGSGRGGGDGRHGGDGGRGRSRGASRPRGRAGGGRESAWGRARSPDSDPDRACGRAQAAAERISRRAGGVYGRAMGGLLGDRAREEPRAVLRGDDGASEDAGRAPVLRKRRRVELKGADQVREAEAARAAAAGAARGGASDPEDWEAAASADEGAREASRAAAARAAAASEAASESPPPRGEASRAAAARATAARVAASESPPPPQREASRAAAARATAARVAASERAAAGSPPARGEQRRRGSISVPSKLTLIMDSFVRKTR